MIFLSFLSVIFARLSLQFQTPKSITFLQSNLRTWNRSGLSSAIIFLSSALTNPFSSSDGSMVVSSDTLRLLFCRAGVQPSPSSSSISSSQPSIVLEFKIPFYCQFLQSYWHILQTREKGKFCKNTAQKHTHIISILKLTVKEMLVAIQIQKFHRSVNFRPISHLGTLGVQAGNRQKYIW